MRARSGFLNKLLRGAHGAYVRILAVIRSRLHYDSFLSASFSRFLMIFRKHGKMALPSRKECKFFTLYSEQWIHYEYLHSAVDNVGFAWQRLGFQRNPSFARKGRSRDFCASKVCVNLTEKTSLVVMFFIEEHLFLDDPFGVQIFSGVLRCVQNRGTIL